jgi:hypothetical protein
MEKRKLKDGSLPFLLDLRNIIQFDVGWVGRWCMVGLSLLASLVLKSKARLEAHSHVLHVTSIYHFENIKPFPLNGTPCNCQVSEL